MRLIFLITGMFLCMAGKAETLDSLGIKKVNDKEFIEHQVDKGQTLYSLSRRYKVTVAEITENNPELATGLKVGQILLIPVKKSSTGSDKPAQKPAENPAPKIVVIDTAKYLTHEVKAGETLAKIGRDYKVSISQLKSWNKLTSESVNPGQVIIVGLKPAVKAEPKGKKSVKPDTKSDEGQEMNEQGTATVLTDPSIDQQRSFCLHPTAPIGTVIMVTNPATNQSTFVRVQGNYTSDGSSVIQLSQAAIRKLGGTAAGFNVNLNYRK